MELLPKNILVPIDFSDNSKNAFRYALLYAQAFNAKLHVLYVLEPVIYAPDFTLGQIALPAIDTTEVENLSNLELKKLIEELVPKEMTAVPILRLGKPFVEIIDYARESNADLIIISSHGHGSVEHILFGSTSEKVIKKAPCPVLTLRHPMKGFDYRAKTTSN
jgi:nucleotide-binding universal stress UspA family protein